jgi:hypothetical protein
LIALAGYAGLAGFLWLSFFQTLLAAGLPRAKRLASAGIVPLALAV